MNPPTLRQASGAMGEQLLALAETWPWARAATDALHARAGAAAADAPAGLAPWHHAVVFGALAAACGSAPAAALRVYLHQAALGVIGAGVRAVPVGHTHGQQILASLHEDLYNLSETLAAVGLESAGSNCPAYEVFCHEQTRLYTRIFRS